MRKRRESDTDPVTRGAASLRGSLSESDRLLPASDRFEMDLYGVGTTAGAALALLTELPDGGYYNEPTEVTVVDLKTGGTILWYRYPPSAGAAEAREMLGALQQSLATTSVGEFCKTWGVDLD